MPGIAGPQVVATASPSFTPRLLPSVEWRRTGVKKRPLEPNSASLAAFLLANICRWMIAFLIALQKLSAAALVRPSLAGVDLRLPEPVALRQRRDAEVARDLARGQAAAAAEAHCLSTELGWVG
jgi:hypothetical protein